MKRPFGTCRRHRKQRGYILVATCLSIPILVGVSGLAIDVGRMYITKNEAQAFADSASLAAARQLDGTSTGITRAIATANNNSNKWRFDTQPFTSITTTFGTTSAGTFTATPPNPPTGYTFAQVVATVNLPMFLIRYRRSVGANQCVGHRGTGGANQSEWRRIPVLAVYTQGYTGAVPDDASDPFGYRVGNQYTLRWGSPGDRTDCGTDDTTPSLASNGSIRGYCCVAGNAATIREAIVSLNTDPVTIGQTSPWTTAPKIAR